GYARAAIAIRPSSAEAHSFLGYAQSCKGDYDAAAVAYRQAIDVDPRFGLARFGLGDTLQHKGGFDGGIARYGKGIELEPDHTEGYFLLARALDAKGNHDEALATHRKLLDPLEKTLEQKKLELGAEHEQTIEAMYRLADAYYRAGRHQDGLAL